MHLLHCRPKAGSRYEPNDGAKAPPSSPSNIERKEAPLDTAAKAPRPPPVCALSDPPDIGLYPYIDGHAIVSPTLGKAKLYGHPEIIDGAPEDHHEYWMGRQKVVLGSLPTALQQLSSRRVFFVRPDDARDKCMTTAGPVVALAWADEQGKGWDSDDWPKNARRAFREGVSFLGAPLSSDCLDYPMGPVTFDARVTSFQTWKLERFDEQTALGRLVQEALMKEPAIEAHQGTYEKFLGAQGDDAGTAVLPWWKSSGYTHFEMTLAQANDGSRLVFVEAAARFDQRGGPYHLVSWAGAYCVTKDERLVALGPDEVPTDHQAGVSHYRRILLIMGPPGALPFILYQYFAFVPRHGRYQFQYEGPKGPPLLE